MKRRSKQGFVLSALLHGAVVGMVILVPMMDFSGRDREKQFELVPMPPLGGQEGGGSESAPAAERQFDFNGPDIPAAPRPQKKAPSPPTPAPPAQTNPTPPPPQKKPPPKATTPAKAPAAKSPASAMSYEEFVKKHGAPKASTTKKTAPSGGGSSGRVKGPRVDTDFSGVVRNSVRGDGSRYGSLTGTEMSALGLYIAELKGRLKEAWPEPTELADTLATNMEFTVSGEGRISNVRIAQSSGNRLYDQTVLAAFSGVGNVGPTPDGKPLLLRLTFKMNED